MRLAYVWFECMGRQPMMKYAFAAPILPGKTDAARQWVETVLGPKKAEYDDLQKRMGVEQESYFLMETPDGDMMVMSGEGTWIPPTESLDLENREFDRWFAEQVEDICGFDVMTMTEPPASLLGTWESSDKPATAPAAD